MQPKIFSQKLSFAKRKACISQVTATENGAGQSIRSPSVLPVSKGMFFSLSRCQESLQLQTSYDRLPHDPHRPGQSRRFSKVIYYPEQGSFQVDPDTTFYQSIELNQFNKGSQRVYEHVEPEVLKSEGMKKLLNHFIDHVVQHDVKRRAMFMEQGCIDKILINQIRTVCYPQAKAQYQQVGFPVPEGIHKDGMDFVLITCIRRENIVGAQTSLFINDDDEAPFMTMNLDEGFTLLLDDHEVFHYVSKIEARDKLRNGVRDVIVLSVQPWED